jgi:hypothetical protein
MFCTLTSRVLQKLLRSVYFSLSGDRSGKFTDHSLQLVVFFIIMFAPYSPLYQLARDPKTALMGL